MRFLITSISEAFKEVNLEDLESEIRDCGLRAMKEAMGEKFWSSSANALAFCPELETALSESGSLSGGGLGGFVHLFPARAKMVESG